MRVDHRSHPVSRGDIDELANGCRCLPVALGVGRLTEGARGGLYLEPDRRSGPCQLLAGLLDQSTTERFRCVEDHRRNPDRRYPYPALAHRGLSR